MVKPVGRYAFVGEIHVMVMMHLVLYRVTQNTPPTTCLPLVTNSTKPRKQTTQKPRASSPLSPPSLNLDHPLVSPLAFPFVTRTPFPSAFSSSTSFASFETRQDPRCFLGCTSSVPLLDTRSPFGPSFISASLSGISLQTSGNMGITISTSRHVGSQSTPTLHRHYEYPPLRDPSQPSKRHYKPSRTKYSS